jgi:membrane-bound lytic murein transglycosylase D
MVYFKETAKLFCRQNVNITKNEKTLNYMKQFILILLLIVGHAMQLTAQSYNDTFESDIADGSTYEINEEDIRYRFMNLTSCIEPQWTDEIKNFIKSRLKHKESTQKILGRTFMYAPYVEKCITENGLPLDLQALYIIESGLNPRAISSAGAGGLWQLMPETAKSYGVSISSNVDERFDPYKSTQAAMNLLKALHKKYNDWALALAAYNAGPARVDWAIKHGKSTDFWKIRRFMMKETQNYVPAFLAASYVMQNYPWHNIKPKLPELDLQISAVVKMKEYMSFSTISQIIDVPVTTIQELNPSYINDFIPATMEGSYVIVPARVRRTFENYINTPVNERIDISGKPIIFDRSSNGDDNYVKTTVTVSPGDNLSQVAEAFNCYAHNIKAWNFMTSLYIGKEQDLSVYVPKVSETYSQPTSAMDQGTLVGITNNSAAPVVTTTPVVVEPIPTPIAAVENTVVYGRQEAVSSAPVVVESTPIASIENTVVYGRQEAVSSAPVVVESTPIASIENTVVYGRQEAVSLVPVVVEPTSIVAVENTVVYGRQEAVSSVPVIVEPTPIAAVENTVVYGRQEAVSSVPVIVEPTPIAAVENTVAPVIVAVVPNEVETNNLTSVLVAKAAVGIETKDVPKLEVIPQGDVAEVTQPSSTTQQPQELMNTSTNLSVTEMMKQPDAEKNEVAYSNPLLKQIANKSQTIETPTTQKFIYHYLGRNESLMDVAEYYENITVEDLLALNGYKEGSMPTVGAKIKIKSL